MNNNSNLVKEIKDAVHTKHGFSLAVSKGLDIFDTLLIALNGLCCKYSLSYEDHKIFVYVFPAVSYPERTFIIDVTKGMMNVHF